MSVTAFLIPRRRTICRLVLGGLLVALPFLSLLEGPSRLLAQLPFDLDRQVLSVIIFALLALALHLELGLAGLMQLGIAAPFALGAFFTGILTVEKYPFQMGFFPSVVMVPLLVALFGLVLGLPAVLLRGDYVAMVTLGLAEVVRVVLLNLEAITDGSRGLNPLPPPNLPQGVLAQVSLPVAHHLSFCAIYLTGLVSLGLIYWLLGALERHKLGLLFTALRDDALVCQALGFRPQALRLLALGLGSGIAGLAGVLYATYLTTTAEPNAYDFNVSVMVLCSVVVGGLGSRLGAIFGAVLLVGLDNVVLPLVTQTLTEQLGWGAETPWTTMSNWRFLLFGGALVITMRLRPQGLWPKHSICVPKGVA